MTIPCRVRAASQILALIAASAALAPAPPAGAEEMVFPGPEWALAPPESQGVDPGRLAAAIGYLEQQAGPDGVKRLVIVRNGRMIWKAPEADVRQPVASVSKAFTSTAHGLLIDDGKCSLDTLAKDYHPEHLAKLYPTVTLRHLATMTSGYDGVGGTYDCDAEKVRCDANALVPPASPVFPPGTKYMYWDEATQEYGYILTKIAGEPLPEFLKRRILDPIGSGPVAWYNDATGQVPNWTGGLQITASDLARFGHLYLNRGRWNGKQLISENWVDEATKVQVPASIPSGHTGADQREGSGVYGYHWWPNGLKPDGERKWPDAPLGTYARSGFKNNRCFVVPEWNMVIVWLGVERNHKIADPQWSRFLGLVGESLRDRPPAPAAKPRTDVSIRGEQFFINGRPTYAGRTWQGKKIEGLLMNSRMVQGIFDDLNPETVPLWAYPDTGRWDPERNTREFIDALPEWRRHGLLSFTINLQGGSPQGYSNVQPWHNSAIAEDGSLRPDYMDRLGRIIDRADELGMVVILGYFYFGQDERLKDEQAVRRAVDDATAWVLDRGDANVLIEINNECNIRYEHPVLRADRVHELIARVRAIERNGRRLLVGTSLSGSKVPPSTIIEASDFILLHGNGVGNPDRIAGMVRDVRNDPGYAPKPILFNEDDHFDFDRPRNNFAAAVGEYASWGYFDYRMQDEPFEAGYQSVPVDWGLSHPRKRAFFEMLRDVTGGPFPVPSP